MRILIIEDDQTVATYIKNGFIEHGYTADHARDGREGLSMAQTNTYDALIVDRMLPEMDGLSVIENLRSTGQNVPVLILSALGEVNDRVQGLRRGGDDYLVKPFAFSELLARIEVLIKRSTLPANTAPFLKAGDLEIELLSRQVKRDGKIIDLQAREFRLLEYLMKNKGQIVTRTMLLENVWDYNFDPQTNVIDVHISRLRSKINAGCTNQMIRTIRGAGYIIEDPA